MGGNDENVISSDVISRDMIYEPILENGVFRFDCSACDRDAAHPSISFVDSKLRDTPIINHEMPSYIPFYTFIMGNQIVRLELPVGTSLYGTGEVSGPLERTGKRVFTWNSDSWAYESGTTSLYQSHPWVLAIFPTGEALGILADTTRRCEIDLRKESTIKFTAPSSYPVILFGPFASPIDVLISLSHAIGTVFMPPKWSLGYHQCRYSYDSETIVCKIAMNLREKSIPCDAVWMDIDYMDGFRSFTFDKERFPDPKSLVNDFHHNGFKAIWMLDPGIKQEDGFFPYDSGTKEDVWIQTADGRPFTGIVWPGPCVFPDFTMKKARLWWANLVKDFTSNGVDGIWNDMNEPTLFKVVTRTMPECNIHRGDDELGGYQNHSYYHNVYGMLMARSTFEGMKLAHKDKRPFVLARAGYIGSQRYAATWTGDNVSTWEHLQMSVAMTLQLGLSGQPLSGPDIGGYAGNATPKLFARWMGIGAMLPFCRGHSENDTLDHEPWSFGPECEEVCCVALKRRYRFIPHLYTLFYLAHTIGTPVATPTFFADPKDTSLRKLENSFLLGPLLVYASTMHEQEVDDLHCAFPKGIWLRFDFDDSHPDLPAIYLQGGAIIPLGPPHEHIGQAHPSDDLTLVVALDEQGKAKGLLFEDDGDGYGFTEGHCLLTHYVAKLQSSIVTVRVSKTEGSWKRPNRPLHLKLLLGGGAMLDMWGTDGEVLQIVMPSEDEVSRLVSASTKLYKTRLENANRIPEVEEIPGHKGVKLSKYPMELKGGDWSLKIVPWIGGRMISMLHIPSGIQWLYSRIHIFGYEEFSSTEFRSAGWSEEYSVIKRNLKQEGEEESLSLEGDIGSDLVLKRQIYIPKNDPKFLHISSSIVLSETAATVDSSPRLVCLRVHPVFHLLHPAHTFITFISIDGSRHEMWPEFGEQFYQGNLLPNGEWMLVDTSLGLALVNQFDIQQVQKCLIHWGTGFVKMELWSEERYVMKKLPLGITHRYKVITIP